jgi:hypothetical protein
MRKSSIKIPSTFIPVNLMDDLGKMIGSMIFVGLVFGTAMFMGQSKPRTAWTYLNCFFSAIVGSLILGAIWYWIGHLAGYN